MGHDIEMPHGEAQWQQILERQPRIVSCSGPVLLTGGTLRGYSRVIWIPSALGKGHHINLDPSTNSAFWEFTLGMWQIAYLRLNDIDLKSPGARIGVQVSDPRFRIQAYQDYVPHPNDFVIALRNGDSANVTGGSGDGRVFTAWGEAYDTWRNAPYLNGWVTYTGGPNYYPAQYMKDSSGFVHLRGLVSSGTMTAAICSLPPGYRIQSLGTDTHHMIHAPITSNGGFGHLGIRPNGEIWAMGGSNAWIDLGGVAPYQAVA